MSCLLSAKSKSHCAKCLNRDEVLAQEQLSANGSVSIVDHPHLGTLRIVRTRLAESDWSLAPPAMVGTPTQCCHRLVCRQIASKRSNRRK